MVMCSPITWKTVVQHDVVQQDLADVKVARHDARERRVTDPAGLHELGLEQDFLVAETLVTDSDDVAICKRVGYLQQSRRAARRRSHQAGAFSLIGRPELESNTSGHLWACLTSDLVFS